MKGSYTLIVPALDRTGPVNVAVDIGAAAHAAGWQVRLLYLTTMPPRDDLGFAAEVRQFRLSDFWQLSGVVHTHCLRPDLLGLALTRNRKITLITTIHNNFLFDLGFAKPRLYVDAAWQVWRWSLRGFDMVICISEAMRRHYCRRLHDSQLHVAYNFRAQPPNLPAASSTLEWIARRKQVGNVVLSFVGALSELKNIKGLLEALADAPAISLIVCGQGHLRESLEVLVRHKHLQDRVRFEGHVPSPAAIMRHTDALILPSHTEGFPLVVIEAASVGVPALLSNIAVHRELADLGFGKTFDHRRFSDLESAAYALHRAIPAPSTTLVNLWFEGFTPSAGFARYEALISTVRKPL